jgi:hypothetical protein
MILLDNSINGGSYNDSDNINNDNNNDGIIIIIIIIIIIMIVIIYHSILDLEKIKFHLFLYIIFLM